MAASLGLSWLQDVLSKPCINNHLELHRPMAELCKANKVESAAEESKRMVELMLGSAMPRPFTSGSGITAASAATILHTTLDLLGGSSPARSGVGTAALPCSSVFSEQLSYAAAPLFPSLNDEGADIELEMESPLPSGWEKCLDLKTGNIYYLNRNTGLTLPSHSRKAYPRSHNSSSRVDVDNSWSPSPTTSELTVEASVEAVRSSTTAAVADNNFVKGEHRAVGGCHGAQMLQEGSGSDEGVLDLNLSLHVGGSWPVKAQKVTSMIQPLLIQNTTVASSSSTTSSPNTTSCFTFSQKATNLSQGLVNTPHLFKREERISAMDGPNRTHNLSGIGPAHCSSMVTVACSNCLMFVMLSRNNPKCPRCGTCPHHLDSIIPDQPPLKRPKF